MPSLGKNIRPEVLELAERLREYQHRQDVWADLIRRGVLVKEKKGRGRPPKTLEAIMEEDPVAEDEEADDTEFLTTNESPYG